jgi:hypothetical protein
MKKKTWSIKQLQDLVLDQDEWDRKNLYATDFGKCPRGIYYALKGEKPDTAIDPEGLRRMEVGKMIEYNQIKKMKAMGIFLGTQDRVFDEKYNVSGRIDALIISPDECTPEAKGLIKRKKEIFEVLEDHKKNLFKGINQFNNLEINEDQFREGRDKLMKRDDSLYSEERQINNELLKPNKKNSLMVIEIKSISEWGFKFREREGIPMEAHSKQTQFYLWKLRDKYPNILARVLYVQIPYQNLLEFDIPYSEEDLMDLQRFWTTINKAIKVGKLPPAAPSVVKSSINGKWQVNYQAEWCRHHIKCTGDSGWLDKAIKEVQKLNKKHA